MSKTLLLLSLIIVASLAGCGDASVPMPAGNSTVILTDTFSEDTLDTLLWVPTSVNDFRETEITAGDGRLKLRADTIGTDDATVKYLGIRSNKPLDMAAGAAISFDLDWNGQANGCYLTAGMILCPKATTTNPLDEPDWLAFEYIGVPPGQNARFQASRNKNASLQLLFTEGWPTEQRAGRAINKQHIDVVIDNGRLSVTENGETLFNRELEDTDFSEAYIYLQMSSHSNYTSREIYFDNIAVRSGAE